DHALLELQRIARMAEHVTHDWLVEPVDEERESLHAGALPLLEPPEERGLRRRLAQRRIHHLSRLLGAAHREIHARAEHRVDQREGIAEEDRARPAHARGVVGVAAGDSYLVADQPGAR